MSWLASFFIAVISGILGLICTGFIASLCVDWFRISSREGASGYYVIFIALLGGVVSFIIGMVAARYVAAGASPGFLKGVGVACGAILGISLIVLALCRLSADIAPEIDGRPLKLDIEVRCPKGFVLPDTLDEYGATAEVYLPGGRRLPGHDLRLQEAQLLDGHWVVPATVPLTTSVSKKFVSVRFDKDNSLLFGLFLRAHPKQSDTTWSTWVEPAWDAGKPEPPKEAKFNMRWRVQVVQPEPPPPDPEVVRAEQFAALKADPSLAELLPFLFEEPNDERSAIVIKAINERQVELAELIRSTEATTREYALRAAEYPEQPAPEVVEAVLAEGHAIAVGIRAFNTLTRDDASFYQVRQDLNTRFNYWKQAWWTIHQRIGVDGRPPVKEIHDLTVDRVTGNALDEIEVNARVILDELNKSALEKNP
ncbi:MAG: hypothetical protein ABI599_11375 [Flavobacteriales bacterium]